MSNAKALKKLEKNRNTIKEQFNRFNTYVNAFGANDSVTHLQARFERAEKLFDEFNEIQTKIENLQDETDTTSATEREQFENLYFEAIGLARQHVASRTTLVDTASQLGQSPAHARTNTPIHLGRATSDYQNVSHVTLPKITLPTFNGAYDQWLQFHDTFNTLIHQNASLSAIERFYYLQSSLRGDAAQVISSLEVSATNYDVAWNLLKDRFENKRLIIQNHVKALFEIPVVTRESHTAIRQLLDSVLKHIRSLHSLDQPTEYWDTIMVHLVTSKLDSLTKREWETSINTNEIPTMKQLTEFLTKRAQVLESIHSSQSNNKSSHQKYSNFSSKPNFKERPQTAAHVTTQAWICPLCEKPHPLYACETFLKLPINSRINEVKRLKRCLNCLRSGHYNNECRSQKCKTCSKNHNTLLHEEQAQITNSQSTRQSQHENDAQNTAQISMHSTHKYDTHILLSTAVIEVYDRYGTAHQCRVLLDSGSQSNFITERLSNKLQLQRSRIDITVAGINQAKMNITHKVQTKIKSRYNAFHTTINCLILPRITDNVPAVAFKSSQVEIPKDIRLADPNFNTPGEIDILLGASIFFDLLCVGQRKLHKHQPTFQNTKLGWILAGPMSNNTETKATARCYLTLDQSLQENLTKFWAIEELKRDHTYSREEAACEDIFVKTVTHDKQGHFVVNLPLKDNISELGESRTEAIKRLTALERKLERQPDLKKMYAAFMEEYEMLNHMTEVKGDEENQENVYYMPHHAVIKEESETTKVRVVFDASAKTTSGLSLNDALMIGPTIQDDLFSIVIRFRLHRYVVTADVEKMYRQVYVAQEHRDFQRIVWRTDARQPIKTYRLNTVTYGTAAAPFLAIRALHEIALENESSYPDASHVIKRDFYVDDLITGTDSIDTAKLLIKEVTHILSSRGFNLRKFRSNEDVILEQSERNKARSDRVHIAEKERKALGLLWDSELDVLEYSVKVNMKPNKPITKRTILSTISQIFDPLGLIGPTTIKAKVILQRLWQLQLSWDEDIPQDLHTMWTQFQKQLNSMNQIKIPRYVSCSNRKQLQIHGFSDASEMAYGACIYLRSTDLSTRHYITLLCARSRVAPLKCISLPRLELCGALLLSQLVDKVRSALKIQIDATFCWCDSTVTLSWIAGAPNNWKIFVANRVAEIQETKDVQWRHVGTKENPADILSRGLTPEQLQNSELWWKGPIWLTNSETHWPQQQEINLDEIPERKLIQTALTCNTVMDTEFLNKYSSLTKLINITAYCLRFKDNALNQVKGSIKRTGRLSVDELDKARLQLLKITQAQVFAEELKKLRAKNPLSNNSKLLTLNPFLDKNKLIRVGGRLKNSSLTYNQKYPIVIPNKHPLTTLIIEQEHKRLLHAGPQMLLATIRQEYWPLAGLNAVKRILHKCIRCFRNQPKQIPPIMGNLPKTRVTPARPFTNCGVDYAGPFQIKEGRTRGRKIVKAYICLFVCFATKATHIELVNELTTHAFLNAFKRFISRRGKCVNIYSDNATNFVGANNELNKIVKQLNEESNKNQIINFASQQGINWHFIPARSPHFGGLWEAAIKSAKTHLKRILGNVILTFEDIYTILTQIEACLNSRPLTQLSNDPNDLLALTPGHFLIGDSLVSAPQVDLQHVVGNRLTHYQKLQQLVQHFWARWHREYLGQLQGRTKWKRDQPNSLQPGTMVVLCDTGHPPIKWRLGRILETHPGTDGVIRVVTVKVSDGVVTRGVNKICVLPLEDKIA